MRGQQISRRVITTYGRWDNPFKKTAQGSGRGGSHESLRAEEAEPSEEVVVSKYNSRVGKGQGSYPVSSLVGKGRRKRDIEKT